MSRRMPDLFAFVLLLSLSGAARADGLSVPNDSFEEGVTTPTGWVLSGGVGTWENEGHTGSRCLSVTGDGKSSNDWSCPSLKLQPGAFYRIDFWTKSSPDAGGGNVISGTNLCNVDWPHAKEWTHRTIVFRAPTIGDRQFLRFGQWQAKGKVYFDDIRVCPVRPLKTVIADFVLGEGETLRNGRYEFVAPLNRGLNWAQPVELCSAGFNSNRWTLTENSEITFWHLLNWRLSAVLLPLRDAQVEVGIGYYSGGKCVIEGAAMRQNGRGTSWTVVGEIDGSRTAAFRLPREFDGASRIIIRLKAVKGGEEKKPCSFQINSYRFSAQPANAGGNLVGTTCFVEEEPVGGLVGLDSAGTSSRAGYDFVGAFIQNRLGGRLLVQPVIEIDAIRQPVPVSEIPSGYNWGIRILYCAGRAGPHTAKVTLVNAATSQSLYTATWDYQVPVLHDSGFGYAIQGDYLCALWWAEGPYKINRLCAPPAKKRGIEIAAAKGEYEPFQLVVAPKSDMKNLSVKASALQSDRGGKIPAEAVEVCRVGYVNVTTPTDEIGCAGEWPDPLPPCDKAFDLRAGDGCQPLWITVHVPRDAKAGDYRGTIELAASGWKTSVPFTVHVWDFEIPRENHLKTAFGFSTGNVRRYHNLTSDDELRKVVDLYLKNFAEHRISPYDFAPFDPIEVRFPGNPDDEVKVDFSRFDKQAEKYLGPDYRFSTFLLHLQGMGGGTFHARHPGKIGRFEQGSPEYEQIFAKYSRQLESHLRDKGWLDKAYLYWFDEPEPKDYEFVRDGMERIHRAAPGLRRMLTEQPEKELDGAVDIWCPLTPTITPEIVSRERAKGREMWWYICTGPQGPYCTLFIDHYGIEFRMWSWQTWKFGVQGLLIWQSNYWTSDAAFPDPQLQNPWEDPMSYVSGYSTAPGTKQHWGNGDGRFIYPPNRDPLNGKSKYLTGPVNSIRWEMLREGIEDYEYFWLLRDLVEKAKKRGEKGEAVARAESLLKIPDSITSDQTHFAKDPLAIYRYREQVARAIEMLRMGK